jgi:hypothetical protein
MWQCTLMSTKTYPENPDEQTKWSEREKTIHAVRPAGLKNRRSLKIPVFDCAVALRTMQDALLVISNLTWLEQTLQQNFCSGFNSRGKKYRKNYVKDSCEAHNVREQLQGILAMQNRRKNNNESISCENTLLGIDVIARNDRKSASKLESPHDPTFPRSAKREYS